MPEVSIDKVCASRRWFRLTFLAGRTDRELLLNITRDAEAALALQPALCARGFHFAGPIFNYPATLQHPKTPFVFDDSFFEPGDLLVLTTRPPLDDLIDGVRGGIQRSYTTLEVTVLALLRRHFAHCSRVRVRVAERHILASDEIAQMANIQFRQNGGAAIDAVLPYKSSRWQHSRGAPRKTAAYLIYEAQAWPNGPALLASFGMSGTDTLAWNTLLATRYQHLIATTPFVLAEITAPKRPAQPQTLDFLRDWEVRLMIPHGTRVP